MAETRLGSSPPLFYAIEYAIKFCVARNAKIVLASREKSVYARDRVLFQGSNQALYDRRRCLSVAYAVLPLSETWPGEHARFFTLEETRRNGNWYCEVVQ